MKTENLDVRNNNDSERVAHAVEYFMSGYNCAQSIFAAYCELFGIPAEQGLLTAAGLGAGVGRMREVCGAVTASAMILGLKYSAADPSDTVSKAEMYKAIQSFSADFKAEHSSIICRELLGSLAKSGDTGSGGNSSSSDSAGSTGSGDYTPAPRTPDYYKTRPCARLVHDAAALLEKYL